MPIVLLSAAYATVVRGDVAIIDAMVLDADGDLIDLAPIVTVTLPADTTATPTPERLAGGVYRAQYVTTVTGRHLIEVTHAEYGRADAVAVVVAPTSATSMPNVADVDNYLRSGGGEHNWSDEDINDALLAEQSAQARVCRVGAVYPPDMREALLRRVQRNLAMRPLALAMARGDADGGDTVMLPQHDPEVRRLERPYRKLPMG